MIKLYKRFLMIILVPVIIAAFPFLVFASDPTDATPYDWYFKPAENNAQPALIPEAEFIDDYDVLALGSPDEKILYLTFDAGYDNGYHQFILDTLKEKNVPATFFVDGNFVKSHPSLVIRMNEEGHIIGNHSENHADMTTLADFDSYSKEITEWEACVKDLDITPSKYFRFPMGRFSERSLAYNKRLDITSVFWSFAYYDWDTNSQPSEDVAFEKICSRVHNGAVLLLHSTSKTNCDILPRVIDKLRAEGYTFKSLDEFKK